MKLTKVCLVMMVMSTVMFQLSLAGVTQEAAFELPVQLVGFPFIVVAVKVTNFIKKLSYALAPGFDSVLTVGSVRDASLKKKRGLTFITIAVTALALGHALPQGPTTYKSRTRRDLAQSEQFDAAEVEKYIVNEFGTRACVFERICAHYAVRAHSQPRPEQLDWPDVFGQYKRSEDSAKEYYLLSVFLGDIVGSPQLCHQLGKRRPCDASMLGDE